MITEKYKQLLTDVLARNRQADGNTPVTLVEDNDGSVLEDLGVVTCYFGNDQLRREACRKGLTSLLQLDPQPAKLILVEITADGTAKGSLAEEFNDQRIISYTLRLATPEDALINQKHALFAYGIRQLFQLDSKITKVLCLDGDVAYENLGALHTVSESLDTYELITPFSYAYRTEQPDASERLESAAISYQKQGWVAYDGFMGYGFGCTKQFFQQRLHGQLPTLSGPGVDLYFYQTILGVYQITRRYLYGWVMPALRVGKGLPGGVKFGYPNEVMFHYYHGKMSDRGYNQVGQLYRLCLNTPAEDIKLSTFGTYTWEGDHALPSLMRQCREMLKREPDTDALTLYRRKAAAHYGSITPRYPLYIITAFNKGEYTLKDVQHLQALLRKYCKTEHQFLCLTDEEIPGVTTVKPQLNSIEAPGWWRQLEFFRQELYPANASVLTLDLDIIPFKDFTLTRADRHLNMFQEIYNRDRSWCLWSSCSCYFQNRFGWVFDEYRTLLQYQDTRAPEYRFLSPQEFISGVTFKYNEAIGSVQKFLQIMAYDPNRYWRNASLVHFLGVDKPWMLKERPEYIPEADWNLVTKER